MARETKLPTTLEEFVVALAVAAAVIAVAGVLYWLQTLGQAKQRAALKALAERLHWDPEPGDTAEDAFVRMHQGWLVWLGMRLNVTQGRGKHLQPTLHVDLELALPRRLEAIPKDWQWGLIPAEQRRCFTVGVASLDARFVWMCDRAEQSRAQALLGEPDVQRALLALSDGSHGAVRLEKERVSLILPDVPEETVVGGHAAALTAVATALRQALAPARNEVRRGA
ncbi:hypothetical protein [Melittangium boletus]|uniref:hypothetical protein n=1 Tax=Melittangium boletus TaxID=83453 RepID=UPI003DA50953